MRKTACQLLLASGLLVTGGRAATLPAYIEGLNVRKEVGTFKAYIREFPGVCPQNGIVELRFTSTSGHDATIQAVELIPAGAAE